MQYFLVENCLFRNALLDILKLDIIKEAERTYWHGKLAFHFMKRQKLISKYTIISREANPPPQPIVRIHFVVKPELPPYIIFNRLNKLQLILSCIQIQNFELTCKNAYSLLNFIKKSTEWNNQFDWFINYISLILFGVPSFPWYAVFMYWY